MPFPFGWNPPSLGDFIKKCCESNDCILHILDDEVQGSFGKIKPRILIRKDNDEEFHVVLPNDPDDTLLAIPLIAQLCRRLNISTNIFGFNIDLETGNAVIE